ncbi:MAG TPA: DUF2065 domain-containing protein [Xanthobacteraceae bacterium]|nr:DUF2065 domain-containing protein [Xanthobacteraceae bacterium]
MSDLIVAFGLAIAIEGLVFAAFPGASRRAMESMHALPDLSLRITGLAGALIGLIVVWLVRG